MVKYRQAENKKGLCSRSSHRSRYKPLKISRYDLSFVPPVFEYHRIKLKEQTEMNANLIKAIDDLNKVDALMYAIENAFLDIEVVPEDVRKYDKGTSAFYALWDAIKKVSDDLDTLAADKTVIDAIIAVNQSSKK